MKFLKITIFLGLLSLGLLSHSLLAWPMMEEKKPSNRKSLQQEKREETIESFEEEDKLNHQVALEVNEHVNHESSLTRIFHPSLLRKPGSPMDAALDLNFDQDSMYSYSPDQNPSSALPHQPSRLSRHESDEIFGLNNGQELSAAFIEKMWNQIELASTMAFLRIFDITGNCPADGYNAWYAINQGAENSYKPFHLNNPKEPLRFSVPQAENPIIKLGNEPKIIIPGKGYLTKEGKSIDVPEKIPTPEENRSTRNIIYKTFQAFFSDSQNESLRESIEDIINPEKIETEINPCNIFSIFAAVDENDEKAFVNTMDKLKEVSSFYTELEPFFIQLKCLPSLEFFSHYQLLKETKASLASKIVSNSAKGSLATATPFLTGATIGLLMSALWKVTEPCSERIFDNFSYNDNDPFNHERMIFYTYNDIHSPNNSLKSNLFDYNIYVNHSHSINHTTTDYYHYLQNYTLSSHNNILNALLPDWKYDYNFLKFYNATEIYYQNHPYLANRSSSYYDSHFALEQFIIVRRCWENPKYIDNEIANSIVAPISLRLASENLFFLMSMALPVAASYYARPPINALANRAFNVLFDNRAKPLLGAITNALVAPLVAFIAAKYREDYHDTDDVLGWGNSFGLVSRSTNFGVAIGISTGLGLFLAIGYGKIIREHLQASRCFKRASDAWTSLRSLNTRINTAVSELNNYKSTGQNLREHYINKFNDISTFKALLSPSYVPSSKSQLGETALLQNIILKKIDTNIEQCGALIEDLEKINAPLFPTWLSWKNIFLNRKLPPPAEEYEMVPLKSDNDNLNDQVEDPLSLMEEGER